MKSTRLEVPHRLLIVDDNESIHDDFKKILSFVDDSKRNTRLDALSTELFGSAEDSNPVQKLNMPATSVVVPYEFSHAYQGQAALKLVQESIEDNRHFSLAFVDMRMPPGWDGLETIERIWAIAPEIEMVICTAFADHSLDEIQNRLGRTDRLLFLRKPFDIVSVQQIAVAMTRKNELFRKSQDHVHSLEVQVSDKVKQLELERALSWNRVKMGYMGDMAGSVAHEIKNPLTIIQGHSDRILSFIESNKIDVDEITQSVQKICTSTARIVKIIDSMLSLSARPNAVESPNCEMQQSLKMAVDLCEEWSKTFAIRLLLNLPTEPLTVACHGNELQQIMANLLSNAIDAVREVEDKWILVSGSCDSSSIFITVENSGPKINSENFDRIFEPFFSTKALGSGLGLGLSVARSLAKSRKGTLKLNQSANTSFVVSIPRYLLL